tara:strand:- start:173 stop:436 length:264 start_codon:yes stop_codon:yes gene_type:complete
MKDITTEVDTGMSVSNEGKDTMKATKVDLLRAIDTIEHRLVTASKDYHNSEQWESEEYLSGDSFVGTYQEWIDASFDDLRDLLEIGV